MSDKISPELLQEIKKRVNIVDVVAEHVVLKKAGSNFVGLCPFHSERSPSFSVSEGKQLYHCYGCKAGGDLVTFVKEIFGISFVEAVADLAERAGIKANLKNLGPTEAQSKEKEKHELAYRLNRFAAAFYRKKLQENRRAQDYLTSRGLGEEIERTFYLGYASPEWDKLAQHLEESKAPLTLAREIGLIQPSKNNPGYFDLFRNRIIFPILDNKGKVAGFGGRLLPSTGPKGTEEPGPKYLNSMDSVLFSKSRQLYGLYQARRFIRELDEVIIVEGYFDVLVLHGAGFQNVVATCGTALTDDHIKILLRLTSKITLLFDGDSAGQDAMDRAMEMGLHHGITIRGAILPKNKDPDEMILAGESGILQLKTLLQEARPLIDRKIDEWAMRAESNNEERTLGIKQVGTWLKMFKDPTGVAVRLKYAAEKLKVPQDWILPSPTAPAPQGGQNRPGPAANIPQGFPPPQRSYNSQRAPRPQRGVGPAPIFQIDAKFESQVVLRWISAYEADSLAFEATLAQIRESLPQGVTIPDLFEQQPFKLLTAWMDAHASQGTPIDHAVGDLQKNSVGPEFVTQVLSMIAEGSLKAPEPKGDFPTAPLEQGLLRRVWARFSQGLKAALSAAEVKKDNGLQTKLMKDYLDVQRRMKELNYFYDES